MSSPTHSSSAASSGQPKVPPSAERLVPFSGITLLGLLYVGLALLLVYVLIAAWPRAEMRPEKTDTDPVVVFMVPVTTGEGRPVWETNMNLFGRAFADVPNELRLFVIVFFAGLLGAFVHSATSFADYAGNRRLTLSWVWWLLLRLPIGATLALIVYLLIRGGLLIGSSSGSDLQPFGIAGIAALTGLFSKQATDKLREVFDTLFRTADGDAARGDKLENPVPVLTGVEPDSLPAGSGATDVHLIGQQFVAQSQAKLNDTTRGTRFVGPNLLIVRLEADDVATAGRIEIQVSTPPPGGGVSEPQIVNVM